MQRSRRGCTIERSFSYLHPLALRCSARFSSTLRFCWRFSFFRSPPACPPPPPPPLFSPFVLRFVLESLRLLALRSVDRRTPRGVFSRAPAVGVCCCSGRKGMRMGSHSSVRASRETPLCPLWRRARGKASMQTTNSRVGSRDRKAQKRNAANARPIGQREQVEAGKGTCRPSIDLTSVLSTVHLKTFLFLCIPLSIPSLCSSCFQPLFLYRSLSLSLWLSFSPPFSTSLSPPPFFYLSLCRPRARGE